MLAVNVVMINGRMIGCTVSDRWNLETAGLNPTHTASEARAILAGLDMVLRVRRIASVTTTASKAEKSALTHSLLGGLTRNLKRAMGS